MTNKGNKNSYVLYSSTFSAICIAGFESQNDRERWVLRLPNLVICQNGREMNDNIPYPFFY